VMDELEWLVGYAMLGRYEVIDILYLKLVDNLDTRAIAKKLGVNGRYVMKVVETAYSEIRWLYALENYLRKYYDHLKEVEPVMVPSEDGFVCRLCGVAVLRDPSKHIQLKHPDLASNIAWLLKSMYRPSTGGGNG